MVEQQHHTEDADEAETHEDQPGDTAVNASEVPGVNPDSEHDQDDDVDIGFGSLSSLSSDAAEPEDDAYVSYEDEDEDDANANAINEDVSAKGVTESHESQVSVETEMHEPKRQRVSDGADEPPSPAAASSAAAAPASKPKQKLTRTSSAKVHRSPADILCELAPLPACVIRLNFNDWRWVSKWDNDIHVGEWVDELSRKSYSHAGV